MSDHVTGPRADAGAERSSLNAIRQGRRSERLVLPATAALALLLILALLLAPVRAAAAALWFVPEPTLAGEQLPPQHAAIPPSSFGNFANASTTSSFGILAERRATRSFSTCARAPPPTSHSADAAEFVR